MASWSERTTELPEAFAEAMGMSAPLLLTAKAEAAANITERDSSNERVIVVPSLEMSADLNFGALDSPPPPPPPDRLGEGAD